MMMALPKHFEAIANNLLTLIPQQNKEELARYIIRRDMVVELLNLALNKELAIQKEWAKKKLDGESYLKSQKELKSEIKVLPKNSE
jgi:hypothetical protein